MGTLREGFGGRIDRATISGGRQLYSRTGVLERMIRDRIKAIELERLLP